MHSGRSKALFVCLMVLSLFTWPAFADEKGTMDGTIKWPSEAGGWKRTGEAVRYQGRAIFDYMDGAGEVYLAYNFDELTVYRYTREGHPDLIAELYRMGSPHDAFGVFLWDRQDPDAGIGQGSEFGGGLLRFWKGRYFVSIYGEGEGKEQEEAVLAIGRSLASSVVETGEPPRLIRALPDEHRVQESVKFVRSHVLLNQRCFISNENILGLGPDTEAVFARYDLGKDRSFVLVVAYPDGTKAKSALSAFRKAYALDTDGLAQANGASTGAQIDGARLIIALHAPDADAARQLMNVARMKLREER
jgi:hypothetical protein